MFTFKESLFIDIRCTPNTLKNFSKHFAFTCRLGQMRIMYYNKMIIHNIQKENPSFNNKKYWLPP
jgi:hypothetical protein